MDKCQWCGREQEYLMIKSVRGRARKVCFACGNPLDGSQNDIKSSIVYRKITKYSIATSV